MNYRITINDKIYEVEVEDVNARPIVAKVNGTRFEVQPESGFAAARSDLSEQKPASPSIVTASAPGPAASADTLVAPLPGTVTEVFVKPGDSIEAGQVILVIEAMKMKNNIRATRGGIIKEVLVSAGQSVAHKQALAKFEE